MPTCDIHRGGSLLYSDVDYTKLVNGIRDGNRVIAFRGLLGWPPQKVAYPYGFPFWDCRVEMASSQDVLDDCTRAADTTTIAAGVDPDEIHIGTSVLRVVWVETLELGAVDERKSIYCRLLSGPMPEELDAE